MVIASSSQASPMISAQRSLVNSYPAEHNRLFEPVRDRGAATPKCRRVLCASIAAGAAVQAKSSTTGRSSQGHH